jgi:hypothetical protein
MPEVIIVDEIGTAAEALAARTIAERGVQLIGTAHGNTLENIVRNPTLSDLIGGVQTVTLGDEEARFRGTQKTVSERKAPPTFDAVVEIVGHEDVIVHADTAQAVDELLRGREPGGVRRTPQGAAPVTVARSEATRPEAAPVPFSMSDVKGPVRIYSYALGRDAVERVIRNLRLDAVCTNKPERANLIVTLRSKADDNRLLRIVQATGLPVHAVKKNTTAQIGRLLQNVFNQVHGADEDEVAEAMREMEIAIRRALNEGVIVALAPRPARIRRAQHRIATRHHVVAESVGSEPERHLVVHPHAFAALADDQIH